APLAGKGPAHAAELDWTLDRCSGDIPDQGKQGLNRSLHDPAGYALWGELRSTLGGSPARRGARIERCAGAGLYRIMPPARDDRGLDRECGENGLLDAAQGAAPAC